MSPEMEMSGRPTEAGPGRIIACWAALAVLSALLSWAFVTTDVPAALLLGPMLAAIIFGVAGAPLRLPRPVFQAAQSVVGCLIARSITAAIVASVARDWPAMLLVTLTTIGSAGLVGWALGRFGDLPGSSAAWGTSPGGASAMVAMAEEFGADPRLVAFMQYVRVVCVVVAASAVAHTLFGGSPGEAVPAASQATTAGWPLVSLAETLAIAAGGGWLGRRLPVPAGGLMVPMLIGAALHATGLVEITLPGPVLVVAYLAIGWYVGLRFTRATLRHVVRSIPQVVVATLATIAFGVLSAFLLVRLLGTDPLTAFLATSPGGIDSVAIIAVGSHVDLAFVMALQTMRVLMVIVTGPSLARLIARASARR